MGVSGFVLLKIFHLYSNERSESDAKSFQLMTDMHNEIQRKEEIIEQLKQLIEVLKQRERERDAPIGLVIILSLRCICCSVAIINILLQIFLA